ncbi:hypothetical protein DF105_00975 [Burkholderia stagnalis]|uniref:NUMOD3 domain-containing DNA-binding protein n=1 Tax=Burkholderia stagnalis TaxID=1503054 RepID=UPI000F602DE7|nr:hypothetical protein DF105_00975 [Burkholderia stagnalis]
MSESRKQCGVYVILNATKGKLSAAHTGKVLSEDHRRKLSDSHQGKRSTPESRAKASAALKGRPKSPETRARMALAQQQRRLKELGSSTWE